MKHRNRKQRRRLRRREKLFSNGTQCAHVALPLKTCITRHATQCSGRNSVYRGKLVGASILCFCIDPVHSCVYFLLGKEQSNIHWPSGSCKWSDFGGKPKRPCDTAENTAAREFIEETMGMVKYFETDTEDTLPRHTYHDIAHSLAEGEFAFQLCITSTQDTHFRKSKDYNGGGVNPVHHHHSPQETTGTVLDPWKRYVTFVKQIPWDPTAISRFKRCREMLIHPEVCTHVTTASDSQVEEIKSILTKHPAVHVRNTSSTLTINPEFLEKCTLGLWSIPLLRDAINNKGVLRPNEVCREPFLSLIEIVLTELAFYEPHATQE